MYRVINIAASLISTHRNWKSNIWRRWSRGPGRRPLCPEAVPADVTPGTHGAQNNTSPEDFWVTTRINARNRHLTALIILQKHGAWSSVLLHRFIAVISNCRLYVLCWALLRYKLMFVLLVLYWNEPQYCYVDVVNICSLRYGIHETWNLMAEVEW